jgi:hypothetical protein
LGLLLFTLRLAAIGSEAAEQAGSNRTKVK